MIYALNNSFTDYITNKENLPLLIVLAVIAVAILVLIVVMVILSMKAKKRSRLEAENAARELAEVPPDEEYLPLEPEEAPEAPEETPAEPAPAAPAAPAEEPEPPKEEPKEEPAAPAAAETQPSQPQEQAKEEQDMATKKPEPAKKAEPAKKTEPVKETKKPAPAKTEPAKSEPAKSEPAKKETKKPEAKKPEPVKVSAANGKWVIEAVKGKYWLSLIAPNGQVMLESPTPYATLASARSGIKTYQDNIAANRLEITEHKNGDSQVQVLTAGGRLLATSSTYSSRSQAESAKESIKRWASTTAVEEISEKKE